MKYYLVAIDGEVTGEVIDGLHAVVGIGGGASFWGAVQQENNMTARGFLEALENWRESDRHYIPDRDDETGLWGIISRNPYAIYYEYDMTQGQAEMLAFVEETCDPDDFETALAIMAEHDFIFEEL